MKNRQHRGGVSGHTQDVTESYIIRVYRYQPDRPQNLVGTIERPGLKEKKAFTNLEELWNILHLGLKEGQGHGIERKKSPYFNEL